MPCSSCRAVTAGTTLLKAALKQSKFAAETTQRLHAAPTQAEYTFAPAPATSSCRDETFGILKQSRDALSWENRRALYVDVLLVGRADRQKHALARSVASEAVEARNVDG